MLPKGRVRLPVLPGDKALERLTIGLELSCALRLLEGGEAAAVAGKGTRSTDPSSHFTPFNSPENKAPQNKLYPWGDKCYVCQNEYTTRQCTRGCGCFIRRVNSLKQGAYALTGCIGYLDGGVKQSVGQTRGSLLQQAAEQLT